MPLFLGDACWNRGQSHVVCNLLSNGSVTKRDTHREKCGKMLTTEESGWKKGALFSTFLQVWQCSDPKEKSKLLLILLGMKMLNLLWGKVPYFLEINIEVFQGIIAYLLYAWKYFCLKTWQYQWL